MSSFAEISPVTARAIELAKSGRPGPVVVVVSKDILDGRVGEPAIVGPSASVRIGPDPSAVTDIARSIEAAERPLVIAGEMIASEACHEGLEAFADKTGAAVLTAYRQQDVFSSRHPAYAGHLALNQTEFQARAFDESDLVISIGHRMDSVTTADYTIPPVGKPLIMIHPDPAVFSQWHTQISMGSHCAPAMTAIGHALETTPSRERIEWRDNLHREQVAFTTLGDNHSQGSVDMARVVSSFSARVAADSVVITDAGTFSRWVQRYYPFTMPRTALGPISGAMGYGVPGGLGAAVADPSRSVFCVGWRRGVSDDRSGACRHCARGPAGEDHRLR